MNEISSMSGFLKLVTTRLYVVTLLAESAISARQNRSRRVWRHALATARLLQPGLKYIQSQQLEIEIEIFGR